MKHVLIVGGGFAGLNVAKNLVHRKDLKVTLIDRRNHHLFQPLLYQVAMAGLSPADIATPIRTILAEYKNSEVVLGNVKGVDLKNRKVQTDVGEYSYDYLVLACGAQHSYFGHNNWEEFAPGLKTLEQATEIRRRILLAFEKAETEHNLEIQKRLLTFIVIGGGPTGVELAGALGEISRFTLGSDFHFADPRRTRIILIEAGARILPQFSEELARRAVRDLENLGVQVWTSSRVTDVNSEGVTVGAERVLASTVLWAAGVQPSSLNKLLDVPLDSSGRVIVEPTLNLKNFAEVFVLGDQAHVEDNAQKALPGLAPVALQEGVATARNIVNALNNKPLIIFSYVDKGQMATIGRKKAIAEVGNFKFSGFLAWMMWLVIHIYFLIGFKNRLFVMLEWAWSYFTFKRGARLILNKEWRLNPAQNNSTEKREQ